MSIHIQRSTWMQSSYNKLKRYPVFNASRPIPLKLGTYEEILADNQSGLEADEVKRFIVWWTKQTGYFEATLKAPHRVGILGDVHPIADRHRHRAAEIIAQRCYRKAAA